MIGTMASAFEMRRLAQDFMEKAKGEEAEGRLAEAAECVRNAATALRSIADRETVIRDQTRLFGKARELDEMAASLQAGKRVFGSHGKAKDTPVSVDDEYKASVDDLEYRSPVTWDDIGGMEEVKRTLKFVFGTMLARHPDGVDLGIGRRVLLYGPPGTGKTLLAAACSRMLDAAFFNVKASDLLSKYFGESTKLVSALFARARDRAAGGAAVIFIDEIEALSRDRSDASQSGTERRIIATLLSELDGMAEKGVSTGVITIAATNEPQSIDEAILQRFQKHIYVGLPDESGRRSIFEVQLRGRGLRLDADVTLDDLARRTNWYSGRLIANVCNVAVERMVKGLNGGIPMRVDDKTIAEYTLQHRPLTAEDFKFALERVRPTATAGAIQNYETWAEKIGGDRV